MASAGTLFTPESAWNAIGAQLARPLRAQLMTAPTPDEPSRVLIPHVYTVETRNIRRVSISFEIGPNDLVQNVITITRVDLTIHIDIMMPRPIASRYIEQNPGYFTIERQTPSYTSLTRCVQFQEEVEEARDNTLALMALWVTPDPA